MPLTDYLIVVPLEQEWEQVKAAVPPREDDVKEVPANPHTYFAWHQPIKRFYSGDYLVAGVCVSLWTPGGADTAAITTSAIARWKPSGVLLVGIAGSIDPDSVKLGDVVVPAEVHGYEVNAAVGADFELRPTFDQPGALGFNRVRALRGDKKAYGAWQQACFADAANHGLGGIVKQPPTLHLGVIGSGNTVVRSTQFGERLKKEINRYIVAVEMEARAVHRAIYQDAGRSDTLVIRGISDYADSEKDKLEKQSHDGWRKWAAANAARLTRAILERGVTTAISPPLALDLTTGPWGRSLDPDIRNLVYAANGAQYVWFPQLLHRHGATPELLVVVRAIGDRGTRMRGLRGRCIVRGTRRAPVDGVSNADRLVFRLRASELNTITELHLSAPEPMARTRVDVYDRFGRSETAVVTF